MLSLSPKLNFATATHSIRALLLASFIIFGTGCNSFSSSATLNMDIPANFSVTAEAYYQPFSPYYCYAPENYARDPNLGVKKFKQPWQPTAQTAKFNVKLLPSIGGCLTLLSEIKIWIMDMTEDPEKLGLSAVWIHINDLADEPLDEHGSNENMLSVECKYADSRLSKVFKYELVCKGQSTNDEILGRLRIEQFQDKPLRLTVRMTE